MMRFRTIFIIPPLFLFLVSSIFASLQEEEKRKDLRTFIEEEKYSPEIKADVFIVY